MKLDFDETDLRPLIKLVVAEVLEAIGADKAQGDDKAFLSEQEAARFIGVKVHSLRDARLRGDVDAYQIVGRRIRYRKQDLIDYVMRRKWER